MTDPEELARLLNASLAAAPLPDGELSVLAADRWVVVSFVLTPEQAAAVTAAVARARDELGDTASDGDALVELVNRGAGVQ